MILTLNQPLLTLMMDPCSIHFNYFLLNNIKSIYYCYVAMISNVEGWRRVVCSIQFRDALLNVSTFCLPVQEASFINLDFLESKLLQLSLALICSLA